MALRREEGEHHAAADEEPVDARQEVLDDAELVADLGSAEDDRVRALGVLGEAVEDLDLLLDEEAGRGRQDLGELVDARLLAVHDAEAVRHERVAEFGELRGERAALRLVLRRLARVEPQVLDDRDVAVLEGRRRPRAADSPTVSRANATGLPSSSESRWATGSRLYFGSGAPSGRPRCEQTTTRAPWLMRALSVGRDARTRPSSVMTAVLQGDVEVTADDDALACERTQRIEGAQSHGDAPRGARRRTR